MNESREIFKEVILVEDIPEEGIEKIYDDMPGLLDDVEDCWPIGQIAGHISLKKIEKGIYVTGDLDVELGLRCHRCLEEYHSHVNVQFSYILLTWSACEIKEQIELKSEDMETTFFDGVEVPVSEFFREQILLQLPMKQLCSEQCKGLCPGCGANLNIEQCRCDKKQDDSPFALLKRFKVAGN